MSDRNAVILHGHSSTANSFWHPYLKNELEKKEYKVWLPTLPDTEHPRLKSQLEFVLDSWEFTKDTVIISHSSGVPLTLALLEAIQVKIKIVISVAGFITPVDKESEYMLKDTYDWNRIKDNALHFITINSDNDPWGCNDKEGRKIFEKLGGTQIIFHGEGHMGSESFKQPYKEFPLLVKLIEAYE